MSVSVIEVDRRRAYALTLSMFVFTTVSALAVWSLDLGSWSSNFTVGAAIMISGIFGGIMLLRAGLICAVLPYFLIGFGAFFGFGTLVMLSSPEAAARLLFTVDLQSQALPMVNAANSLVGLIVLAIAGPFFLFMKTGSTEGQGLSSVLRSAGNFSTPMLVISFVVVFLQFASFPPGSGGAIDSINNLLRGLPLLSLILLAANWTQLNFERKVLTSLLVVALTVYGFATLYKANVFMPITFFAIGLILGGSRARLGVALIVTAFLFYVGFVAEVVNYARDQDDFDPLRSGLVERAEITWRVAGEVLSGRIGVEPEILMLRFSVVPFQTYFMTQFDAGFPGDSLNEVWTNLIPRFLWPDKPVFAPGQEFDIAYRGYDVENSLAISFIGEAYWNLGWPGLILVSVIVGLQMGWFTRKWIKFTTEGRHHFGVFLMSPILIVTALSVEGNFVGTFVTGVVRIFILVVLIDTFARMISDYRRIRTR